MYLKFPQGQMFQTFQRDLTYQKYPQDPTFQRFPFRHWFHLILKSHSFLIHLCQTYLEFRRCRKNYLNQMSLLYRMYQRDRMCLMCRSSRLSLFLRKFPKSR
jgi:hypothetical protein